MDRGLIPLLDVLANKVKAIRRLRELLTTKLHICHVSSQGTSCEDEMWFYDCCRVRRRGQANAYNVPGCSSELVLQMGAAPMSSDVPVPCVADLADQVADVLHFFRLVQLQLDLCFFPFVRGILFPMVFMQQTYVGNSTDLDDEPDGENPCGVKKDLEAMVFHPEQAGSRFKYDALQPARPSVAATTTPRCGPAVPAVRPS
ncbi:hypothetical protein ZEAMMB73_Zm00001d046990, partial [Zea mays]